jgi:molybdopterin-guanine dinucleotide biosynthesis protein A
MASKSSTSKAVLQITGLILAGGRSSRMGGTDKGLIHVGNSTMLELVSARLRPQVADLLISANRNLDQYRRFGYAVLEDQHQDFRGPLAGIAQGLDAIGAGYLLTAPCDGPLLPLDLGARMAARARSTGAELLYVFDGEYKQPAYLMIHRGLADNLRGYLQDGGRKIDPWLKLNQALAVDFSDQKQAFRNINTPEDLAELEPWLAHDPNQDSGETTQ